MRIRRRQRADETNCHQTRRTGHYRTQGTTGGRRALYIYEAHISRLDGVFERRHHLLPDKSIASEKRTLRISCDGLGQKKEERKSRPDPAAAARQSSPGGTFPPTAQHLLSRGLVRPPAQPLPSTRPLPFQDAGILKKLEGQQCHCLTTPGSLVCVYFKPNKKGEGQGNLNTNGKLTHCLRSTGAPQPGGALN